MFNSPSPAHSVQTELQLHGCAVAGRLRHTRSFSRRLPGVTSNVTSAKAMPALAVKWRKARFEFTEDEIGQADFTLEMLMEKLSIRSRVPVENMKIFGLPPKVVANMCTPSQNP